MVRTNVERKVLKDLIQIIAAEQIGANSILDKLSRVVSVALLDKKLNTLWGK